MEKSANKKRVFSGVVLSAKMEKTLVVKVTRVKRHSKYLKQYLLSKNYKVHDERKQYKEGDRIKFVECRPLSREKRWRVIYI